MLPAGLRATYSAPKWAASQPVEAFGWLRQLRVEAWTVEGTEQGSQLPLRILCAVTNEGKNRNYILRLIFGENYGERFLGRFWLWDLSRAAATVPGCSMILPNSGESHVRFSGARDRFCHSRLVVRRDGSSLQRNGQPQHQGGFARIRKAGLRAELARNPQEFDDFYHNMFVPSTAQTYGQCADVVPYDRLKALLGRCRPADDPTGGQGGFGDPYPV